MAGRVTWLGHASVLIEARGARLLTDPVLRARVMHLRRHAPPVDLPERVDAVLISHLHHDHADMPTLRRLPAGTRVIAPRGAGRVLQGLSVDEVEVGDEIAVGEARVRVVYAAHPVKRMPWGAETPAVGFEVGGIYFAGDTELFDAMTDLAPLDAALLPVWGWGPSLGPGHLDPLEAATALPMLRPRIAVPVHWGTFLPYGLERRHGHLLRQPVEQFVRHAERLAPEVRVVVPSVGEPIDV
jgi:L-ascorbate metabolism protein UlaG (beta-lactamase superfamily)